MWTGRNLVDKRLYTFYTQELFSGSQKCQDSVTGSLNNFIGFGLFCLGTAGFSLEKKNVNKYFKVSRARKEREEKNCKTYITQQYYPRIPSCKGRGRNKLLKLHRTSLTLSHSHTLKTLDLLTILSQSLRPHTGVNPPPRPSHYTV